MSVLLEYRKVNDTYVPLYFKFSTVPTNDINLTSDKLMSLENWLCIFKELDPLLANGSDSSSSSKRNKTFDMDSGRLTVKAKWVKISEMPDIGNFILKILNISSSSAGKYLLKIDVKLSSYFDRIVAELEQKNKSLEAKSKSKDTSHDGHNSSSSKHKKNTEKHRKISDMLPKIKKETNDSSSLSNDAAACNGFDDLNAEDLGKFEEYIPVAVPLTPGSFQANSPPTYNPEKNLTQIEINQIKSEYSPNYVKEEKYKPTATSSPTDSTPIYTPEKNVTQMEISQIESEYLPAYVNGDKSMQEGVTYKPTTRSNKSEESDKSKKLSKKIRLRSFGLFDSSDEDVDEVDQVSSSSHKSKKRKELSPRREKDSSPRRAKESSKEKSRSKKKKVHDVQSSQELGAEWSDISIRNLMNESVTDILATYPEHEKYLTELYQKQIKQLQRSYRLADTPEMAALDIVSPSQFEEMVKFLEKELVQDAEKEHNYSDVIFELIIPEWALAIFRKKFKFSRFEALERLRLQSVAMSNNSQL